MKVENFRNSGWENSTQRTWETLKGEPAVIKFSTLPASAQKYETR